MRRTVILCIKAVILQDLAKHTQQLMENNFLGEFLKGDYLGRKASVSIAHSSALRGSKP